MKIQFDNQVRIAGIGLVPWTRLGPERWFANYKIASLYGWDLYDVPGAPRVVALTDTSSMPQLAKLNTPSLLGEPDFQKLLDQEFAGYQFMTYKSVVAPQGSLPAGSRLLSGDLELAARLENKAEFRQEFADLGLPFPKYKIIERSTLQPDAASLDLLLEGRDEIIVQDEILSGGRGTFRVTDVVSLAHTLESIAEMGGGKRLVVSERVKAARERSVQCVATRYGTFVGHSQKQIIAKPLLANLNVHDGDRFCGGEISPDDSLRKVYPEIRKYALAIGERLVALGYRGIFSVDCLVDQQDKVYVLEVNPRITGMTPLVTALYREGKDIPFYLLHILEIAGLDYTITDDTVDPTPPAGALMVLHSLQDVATQIVDSPHSGLYTLEGLTYEGRQYRLPARDGQQQLLVQRYTPPNFHIKPGGRLVTVLTNGQVTNQDDQLLPIVTDAVQQLLNQVTLKEATT